MTIKEKILNCPKNGFTYPKNEKAKKSPNLTPFIESTKVHSIKINK